MFRIVLSHTRKGYAEAVHRQTTDDFLRSLENAFVHFNGLPKTLIIDNLRAAVARADWFDPELCPKVRSFAEHYGIAILPTKPYTPRHKGKIERGHRLCEGECPQRAELWFPGRLESSPAELGDACGRPAHSWHYKEAGQTARLVVRQAGFELLLKCHATGHCIAKPRSGPIGYRS